VIAIIDYGAGNLRSVQNAFETTDARYNLARDADAIRQAQKIVLPGVGHFGQMMNALDLLGIRDVIRERISAGVPFLGICLGMQALFERSAEAPEMHGLGVFRGEVERFPTEARVPHMGWNEISLVGPSRYLTNGCAYFAHSYYVGITEETAASCDYWRPFAAAVEKDNCFGVQFHPEKSGDFGLEIIRRFNAL